MKVDWKKRAIKAEAERDKAEAYCQDYGNATDTCEAGWWQQRGYICHRCNADKSAGHKCREMKK